MNPDHFQFRVLSYNIHKGFSSKSEFSLPLIRDSIRSTHADVVCLQEVIGENHKHKQKIPDWPIQPQLEYLADEIWHHHSYGQNAVYEGGHHGNAMMSKYLVRDKKHLNISTNRFEQRGLLYTLIEIPILNNPSSHLHVICVHLDLFERGRKQQIQKIIQFIQELENPLLPLILCGDFNDWNQRIGHVLEDKLGLKEAFKTRNGKLAKTFPVQIPFLSLDRIYYRHLEILNVQCFDSGEWKKRSDHAALCADFKIMNVST